MPEKLYEVLGVDEDASRAEIQEAYREEVKESHPDLSDDPDADERFQLVMRAKDVLTDPEERELYDDLGHAMYMDMFGDDDGRASSGGGQSGTDRATSDGSSSRAGASGGASDSEPADSAASTSGSASGGGSSSSAASGSSAGRTTGDGASTSRRSGASAGSGTDGSTGSRTDTSTGSGAGASTGSGTDTSTGSGTGGSTGSEGRGEGPTRGSGGGVSGATVAGEAERSRKEWQAAARRGETDEASPWSTGSAQGDHLEAARVEPGIATKIRSQDAAVTTLVMLVVYPVFLFATIWPTFPLFVNVFIGLVTVGLVVYTMTEPTVSLVVFGVWSMLTPLLLLFIEISLVTPAGLLALTASWVPFLLSVLLTLAMPD